MSDEKTADERVKKASKGKSASGAGRNLQDTFLEQLKQSGTPVTVFLVSGVKLQGQVSDYDGFTVALTRDGATQLVYKRVISTVAPLGPIDLYEGDPTSRPPRRPVPPGPPRGPRRGPPRAPVIERRKLT